MSDSSQAGFSPEQQQYLQGFYAGCEAIRSSNGLPTFAATLGISSGSAPADNCPADARSAHSAAQDQALAAGKKLTPEEQAKRTKDPFQMWDEIAANASAGKFPKGTDIFLYKYHGLFFVAPAQDSFMCRLRFAGGMTNSHQLRGVADLAEQFGGGYVDATTRSNLQIREIKAEHALEIINGLIDLGIVSRGSGADNIRNITATPTAGIDPLELYDVRPLCREMHHYILQHPEMYGLPRKFNIAFDGGGTISALADTNDIGFFAVRVPDGRSQPAGVYFRLELGGITGHGDFARDAGVLLKAEQCIPVAAAILKVFLREGDRTDRKKARLKYVLERFGHAGFLAEVERLLLQPLVKMPVSDCEPRVVPNPLAHFGAHPQRQAGLNYVGVVFPVGRIQVDQLRGLAAIAQRYGSGTIRLTVWQNLLISDIPTANLPAVEEAIRQLGLTTSVTNVRAGLVACTGNAGCRFAASNTKLHAKQVAEYLEQRLELDQPVNIHLTGCHHSCAQHYIGDIGLLATKVSRGEEMVEGYHVFVGGGYGNNREIGRQIATSIPAAEIPPLLERLLLTFLGNRAGDEETFREWSRAQSIESLQTLTLQATSLEPQLVGANA
ncbi:Sulfite reductase [ferredoxin] [Anatilimnocola aggregata]|uniref:Sulfite reductase [ferredoxin] n=1 Tax=Anatilimnocola aggregata TaxID=2528021 RepID=A0A517Y6I4_9BACT|nr:NirA family protein [Anatilimnocola aggregata]QDU25742.1 Sulfite reductase [ferredoxin] [Anatilimnocola aggregata]